MSSVQEHFWQSASAIISQFDLLQHPFYRAWTCGQLSRQDLAFYAGQYYHHVAAFPTYVTALHSRLPDGRLRRQLLANAADEELAGVPHSSLWLQFAEAAGADAEKVRSTAPAPEVAQVVAAFMELARTSAPAAALGAFWAYESQVPRIAREKASGLRNRYGFSEDGCAYFDLHSKVDEFHAAVWKREIDTCLAEGSRAEDALGGVRRAAECLWRLLDFVESARKRLQ